MSFKEFQDGRHLGYRNEKNWAIQNLHVSPKPPTKFQLNLTFRSKEMSFKEFQDGRASLVSERNEFSHS